MEHKKEYVVVVGDTRVTGSLSETDAKAEAARRNNVNHISEAEGSDPQEAKVKQNLMG